MSKALKGEGVEGKKHTFLKEGHIGVIKKDKKELEKAKELVLFALDQKAKEK